jgi:hypothetical protein
LNTKFNILLIVATFFLPLCSQEPQDDEAIHKFFEQTIQPLTVHGYHTINTSEIRSGLKIEQPGSYHITTSNVTLDLGGSQITTENTAGNLIGIIIANSVNKVTIKNGIISSGSADNFNR